MMGSGVGGWGGLHHNPEGKAHCTLKFHDGHDGIPRVLRLEPASQQVVFIEQRVWPCKS